MVRRDMEILALSLIAAVLVQVSCQLFKFIFYSIMDKKLSPSYLFTAGGVPSSHSAFVSALMVSVGIRSGFTSDVFAVAFVFGAIVIYDSFRLRGHVEDQARLINRLLRESKIEEKPVSEMVGHSVPEIISGIAFGASFSMLLTLLFI